MEGCKIKSGIQEDQSISPGGHKKFLGWESDAGASNFNNQAHIDQALGSYH